MRNPIIAPRITLIIPSGDASHFDSLPYEQISLLQVFRSGSASFSSRNIVTVQSLDTSPPSPLATTPPQSSERTPPTDHDGPLTPSDGALSTSAAARPDAINKWQELVNQFTGPSHSRQPTANPPKKNARSGNLILLNINDERVDPPPKEEDLDTRKKMKARMKENNYCAFFHLLGSCKFERAGNSCIYRHGPLLNEEELVLLKNYNRRLPCGIGSSCRNLNCIFGHTCQGQPGCSFSNRCYLAKFHGVDKTAVRVWHSSKAHHGS